MKIAELISGKNDHEEIAIEDVSISVSALKKLIKDGHVHLMPYRQGKTFHLWG
jgi:5,10-methylenetetrahydrofolate reductase